MQAVFGPCRAAFGPCRAAFGHACLRLAQAGLCEVPKFLCWVNAGLRAVMQGVVGRIRAAFWSTPWSVWSAVTEGQGQGRGRGATPTAKRPKNMPKDEITIAKRVQRSLEARPCLQKTPHGNHVWSQNVPVGRGMYQSVVECIYFPTPPHCGSVDSGILRL